MNAAVHITPPDPAEIAHRLRNVLLQADLDCGCRQTLSGALERFAALEQRRTARGSIAAARLHKARIVAVLHFLSELDEVTDGESDRSVFEEMALAFLDIAEAAAAGAAALRALDNTES